MAGGQDAILCIDLGTSMSKAAVLVPGNAPLQERIRVLPVGTVTGSGFTYMCHSTVFVSADAVHFGALAHQAWQARTNPRAEILRSFKMIISSPNLSALIDSRPNLRIDPTRSFTQRDLITLYLAYLLDAADCAAQSIGLNLSGALTVAYTQPEIGHVQTIAEQATAAALIRHATTLKGLLGAEFWKRPLPAIAASAALEACRKSPAVLTVHEPVWESVAAARCLTGDASAPAAIAVLDIGAGTTDLAGYIVRATANGALPAQTETRTLKSGCDAFDRIVLDKLCAGAKRRSQVQLDTAWRELQGQLHQIKQELIRNGKAARSVGGHVYECTLASVTRDPVYKQLTEEVSAAMSDVVEVTRQRALAAGVRKVDCHALGGGRNLPFVPKLLDKVSRRRRRAADCAPRSGLPPWLEGSRLGLELGDEFAQAAIAIGGLVALAS